MPGTGAWVNGLCCLQKESAQCLLHLMLLPSFWGARSSVLTAHRLFLFRKAHKGPGLRSGFHLYTAGSVWNTVGIACWPSDRLRWKKGDSSWWIVFLVNWLLCTFLLCWRWIEKRQVDQEGQRRRNKAQSFTASLESCLCSFPSM